MLISGVFLQHSPLFIEAGTPAEPGACWASVVGVPGKYTVSAS